MANKVEAPGRVLVVDDEKVIRNIMTDFLKGEGFVVSSAMNGREAMDKLLVEDFDLVLADLKMPEMDGMELLAEIKAKSLFVSVIVMTGYGTLETAVETMKRGADDYLLKPFKMVDVLNVVHRSISKRRLEEENIQLKEVMNLYKISEAMSSTLSLPEILDAIVMTITREMDADAVSIHHLEDGNWKRLARRFVESMDGEAADPFGDLNFMSLLAHFADNPYLLIESDGDFGSFLAAKPGTSGLRAFIAVPMHIKAQIKGIACAYAYHPGSKFVEGHSRLLAILAERASTAIENAQLYQRLKQSLQETIQGLVSALEAKDTYTSGHTKRVTEYAVMIAKGMGMGRDEIDSVRHAALLHDIGKIGIRLESLNKPERLTESEYEAFKEHPRHSRNILEPIQFLRDILPVVEAHHERWDGGGYPLGLKAMNIPLGARILTVADAFDAMTSDRPYRRALSRQAAIKELKSNMGTQFDASVVEIFIRELQKSG